MSHLIGRRIVMKFAPDRLRYFNEQVLNTARVIMHTRCGADRCVQIQKHRQNLFNYFLFLRISPLLPNWFVNLASPICSVPFKTFWIGTFFGEWDPVHLNLSYYSSARFPITENDANFLVLRHVMCMYLVHEYTGLDS